jgi:hypothetical protein
MAGQGFARQEAEP